MTDFEKLKQEVESGIRGENRGIPIGFKRLNRYIGIRKRIFTVIAGAPGSGKSAFVHSAYILSPFDWYIANKDKCGIKFKVILFSMERSKVYIYAKWLSRKIFLDQGIYIPIPKLLGWWDEKLTKDEHDLFLMYEEYLNSLLEVVDVIENIHNPTGIFKYVKEYAARNGDVEEIDEYHKVYVPHQSNEVVEVILDHIGQC